MLGHATTLDHALRSAAAARSLLVVCDFDGTLAEFALDPRSARPMRPAVAALQSLARIPATSVVILSGRTTDSLVEAIGVVAGVRLMGYYGAEDLGPALEAASAIRAIADKLESLSHQCEGVRIEHKGASVALHTRGLAPDYAATLRSAAESSIGPINGIHVVHGKHVVEWCGFTPDKGQALQRLRSEAQPDITLYAGDDESDEAAFAICSDADVTIKVGDAMTRARFYTRTPQTLADRLLMLAQLRT